MGREIRNAKIAVQGGVRHRLSCRSHFYRYALVSARFPQYAPRAVVSPLQLCWVKGKCIFRCNLPPALLAERLGSFACHCCNTGGGTDTEYESAHKVNSGQENPLDAPAGIQTHNLSITSPALLSTCYPGQSNVSLGSTAFTRLKHMATHPFISFKGLDFYLIRRTRH